jgi:dihydrodipicolinate synthase/N-acetylneuraminate lyase
VRAPLHDAERSQVVAACARVCGDRGAQLIVGAGTNATRATIARHEELAEVPGVVASLVVVVDDVPYRTGRGLGAPPCWSSRPTRTSPA